MYRADIGWHGDGMGHGVKVTHQAQAQDEMAPRHVLESGVDQPTAEKRGSARPGQWSAPLFYEPSDSFTNIKRAVRRIRGTPNN